MPARPAAAAVANGQGIALIVWYKDKQMESPVFSVDARNVQALRDAKQVVVDSSSSLRGRAHFEESTRVDARSGIGLNPALVIDELAPADAGLYTCTVEFHKAPTQTRNTRVQVIGELGFKRIRSVPAMFVCRH